MDPKLLPAWKEFVEAYDRYEDPNDSFRKMYPGMIDAVYEKRKVDLDIFLLQLRNLAFEEATLNLRQLPRTEFPDDKDLLKVAFDGIVLDYTELDDWLNEFLPYSTLWTITLWIIDVQHA